MKRIIVSLPMRGKERTEIVAEQEAIVAKIGAKLGEPVEMIETYFPDHESRKPLECLADSLRLMADADYAIFCEGWERARGCKIERLCAEEYGVPILELD